VTLDAFLWAERQQESGGNYKASNSIGAMGAYQILASNLAPWEKEAGLPIETGQAFLNDKTEQDKLAAYKLGGYYAKYGDRGAAAMWYSGQPDSTKTYGNPPVYQYVDDVVALEAKAPAGGIGSGTGSTGSGVGGTTANPASSIPGLDILGILGISDLKDTVERIGLVILGALFIIVAILRFTDAGQSLVKKSETGAKIAAVL
jgi:hypothetical protein